MEVSITRIGNSDGIILPKSVMKKYALHRSDILVIDEDALTLSFKKKRKDAPFTGPNTGFFAPLAHLSDDRDAWGGDIPVEEYVASLREGIADEEEIRPW